MHKPIIAILASGRGTDLQSIIDAVKSGFINAEIGVVISDNPAAFALERAQRAGIKNICFDRKKYIARKDFEKDILNFLREHNVEHVILAGFMKILSPFFVKAYKNHIINIHPSLLPSFPGAHAHRDVLACGVKISGCTVHFVDDGTDSGPIIMQAAVPVLDNDTETTLAQRVLKEEHIIYPKAVKLYLEGNLKITGRKVIVTA